MPVHPCVVVSPSVRRCQVEKAMSEREDAIDDLHTMQLQVLVVCLLRSPLFSWTFLFCPFPCRLEPCNK